MDERRFDALTKALVAATPSRREALRRLAGGALATVFGGLALEGASAQRVGPTALTCEKFCDRDADCNFGLRCGAATGRCFAVPDSKNRCNSDGNCPRTETCNSRGRCVNTLAPEDCPECRKSGDCPGDARCRDNGTCRNRN